MKPVQQDFIYSNIYLHMIKNIYHTQGEFQAKTYYN
jgi:hypothetical protein